MDLQEPSDSDSEVEFSQILRAEDFKCPFNQTAKFVCRNKACQQPGLMCFNEKCACHQKHAKCDWKRIQTFLNLINFGVRKIQKEVKQSFDSIIDEIIKLIEQLERIKEIYQNEKKYCGLLETQLSFISLCKGQEYHKITGEKIAAIENQQIKQRYLGLFRYTFRKQRIKEMCKKQIQKIKHFFEESFFLKFDKQKFVMKQMEEDTYLGELNSKRQLHGIGIYTWKDGTFEVGRYQNGVINGYAICIKPDGTRYDHHYLNGLQNGIQFQYMPNGDRFQYGMKNGVRTGSYNKFFANGNFYTELYQECTEIVL